MAMSRNRMKKTKTVSPIYMCILQENWKGKKIHWNILIPYRYDISFLIRTPMHSSVCVGRWLFFCSSKLLLFHKKKRKKKKKQRHEWNRFNVHLLWFNWSGPHKVQSNLSAAQFKHSNVYNFEREIKNVETHISLAVRMLIANGYWPNGFHM